jgi:hypothetical protein
MTSRSSTRTVNGKCFRLLENREDQCTEVWGTCDHYFGAVFYGPQFDERLERFIVVCSLKEEEEEFY